MDNLTREELLAKTGSVYKLVILASRRASELISGAPPLIEVAKQSKVAMIALEEILQGKVGIKVTEEVKETKKTKKEKQLKKNG